MTHKKRPKVPVLEIRKNQTIDDDSNMGDEEAEVSA